MNCNLVFRILVFVVALCCCYQAAVPAAVRSKRSVVEIDNPEETLRILGTLAQRIIESETFLSDKRGLDLGLSRGFSGSQAAKHLMGLSAASFANGPGRRRREAPNFN